MGNNYKHRTPEEMLQHLRENVRRVGDCLEWAGTFNAVTMQPMVTWHGKQLKARRVLADLTGRIADQRMRVFVTCRNPYCLREDHFVVGTQKNRPKLLLDQDSALAKFEKRRTKIRMGFAKRDEVRELLASGMTQTAVAERFGVTQRTVHAALRRWAKKGA